MAQSICVFCSSSRRVDPAYFDVAEHFGRCIAERGHTLVFGGTDIGMMGTLAKSVQRHGGRVVGILPQFMVDEGIAYHAADELIVSRDMRDRKTMMADQSDAFVALPGGFGTLEELFEVITLNHLQQLGKPVAMLNVRGFFDKLADFFEHLFEQQFAKRKYENYYRIAESPNAVFDYLDAPMAPGT